MTYSDGKYTVEVPMGDAGEGFSVWVSFEENGEPISESLTSELPPLKKEENEEEGLPYWILGLILLLLIIMGIIAFMFLKGKDSKGTEE